MNDNPNAQLRHMQALLKQVELQRNEALTSSVQKMAAAEIQIEALQKQIAELKRQVAELKAPAPANGHAVEAQTQA